jgi:ribosomal protein S12 methylthiotransferase accessory factor YcaO
MGFSARLSHKAAAIHALVEMLQGEIALAQRARIKDPFLPGWLEAVSADLPMLAVSEFVEPLSIGYDSVPNGLDICLDRLETSGCDTFFVDHTRPEFGVPVHRAVIPQLCRDKPRWNYERLCTPDERDLSGPPRRDGAGDPPNRVPLMI